MINLSYTKGPTNIALLESTIGDFFEQIVEKYPKQDGLISRYQNVRYTWKELNEIVNQTAKAFMALGMKKGDRLGIWSPNCSQWLITQLATAKIGIIMVNINPAYRLYEMEFSLNHSGCSWLVTQEKFKSSNYHSLLNELIPELKTAMLGELNSKKIPKLRGIITLGEVADPGMHSWNDALLLGNDISNERLKEAQKSLHWHDPISIQYTSGTTGAPKGVTLSHYNILNNGYMTGKSLGINENDRLVIPLPVFHSFGMVAGNLAAITHGSAIIYPNDGFDPKLTLDAIEEEKATALYGVPAMFIAMLTSEGLENRDFSTLRTGMMGGAICPIEIMRHVISDLNMTEIQIGFGMTETSPVATQTAANDNLDKRTTTVGRTHYHIENKIIDEEGNIVPRGTIGEICTRGYNVMIGYWKNPEATAKVVSEDGWMHTGDLAIMDDEGYIQVVGRNIDMIIRAGENIYPREIEEYLITHPKIADINVFGIPSEKYGEEVEAWIRLLPREQLTEEEVKEFCKDKIAHFKIPRYIKFVDEFPMTLSGKAQKFRMREISIEERKLNDGRPAPSC